MNGRDEALDVHAWLFAGGWPTQPFGMRMSTSSSLQRPVTLPVATFELTGARLTRPLGLQAFLPASSFV